MEPQESESVTHAQMETLIKANNELLEKNAALLQENHSLLRRMNRRSLWAFWLTVVWYILILGLPVAVYFYVLEPYFTALGASYETFSAGIQEVPGWKHLNQLLGAIFGTQ